MCSFKLAKCSFHKLKVEPFDFHLAFVVVSTKVFPSDSSEVNLIKYGVVGFNDELFACLNASIHCQTCLFSKDCIVRAGHQVIIAYAEAVVGQTVQRSKPREINFSVKMGKLLYCSVTSFGRSFARKRKIADVHWRCSGG